MLRFSGRGDLGVYHSKGMNGGFVPAKGWADLGFLARFLDLATELLDRH